MITYSFIYMRADGTHTLVSGAEDIDQGNALYFAVHPKTADGKIDCIEVISSGLFDRFCLKKGKGYAKYRNSKMTEYISVHRPQNDGLTH